MSKGDMSKVFKKSLKTENRGSVFGDCVMFGKTDARSRWNQMVWRFLNFYIYLFRKL